MADPPSRSGVTALVDGENVRRSRWPNVSQERLVELCRAWAEEQRVSVVVVFDGRAPDAPSDARCEVVGTGAESADDWIVRRAGRLGPYWLVTSDRALRAAVRPERTIGGGSFLRELGG